MFLRLFSFAQTNPQPAALFAIGSLKLSDQIRWLDSKGLIDPLDYVQRHLHGDWGNLNDAERRANNGALQTNGVLSSRYQVTSRLALVVATNEDRSITVIQLPEESALF